jgi:hypothetical protein
MTAEELPNVVVLCLDTLRKDYYDEFAPRLRALATTRFEGMRAMASWSVPSHASMFTGKLPREHGVHAWNQRMDIPVEETWFDRIPEYRRVGVSANVYAGPVFGFDAPFDSFTAIARSKWFPRGMDVQGHIDDRDREGLAGHTDFVRKALAHEHPRKSLLNGLVLKVDDVFQKLPVAKPLDFGGKSIARELTRELADDRDAPVFAFANLMEVHNPHLAFRGLDDSLYDAPKTFTDADFEIWDVNAAGTEGYESEVRSIRELYGAGAEYLDRLVTEAVHEIQRETDRDTVFVVTADHGENLGFDADERLIHHTSSLSEALLHVPFDVIDPRQADDVTVPGLASHADLGGIVETIVREGSDDLGGFARERAEAEIAGPSTQSVPDERGDYWRRAQHAVYDGPRGLKYVRDSLDDARTWNVGNGPSWQEPAGEEPPADIWGIGFEEWVETITAGRDADEADRDLDESTEDRLKELGYL